MTNVGRHIFVIFDGTGCSAAGGMGRYFTNAFRVACGLKGGRREQHVILYYPGPGSRKVFGRFASRAFGKEVDQILAEAYLALCTNIYNVRATKIYIFGFSRGAVVAKALTELIEAAGVLEKRHGDVARHAINYFLYKRTESLMFVTGKAKPIKIEFVGLFDPVLGPENINIDMKIRGSLCKNVKFAVEIVAMDECDLSFVPNLWTDEGKNDEEISIVEELFAFDKPSNHLDNLRLQQIWLPGGHSDIGNSKGGTIISDLVFLTMMERLHYFTKIGIDHQYITEIYENIMRDRRSLELSWKVIPFMISRRYINNNPYSEIHPVYFAVKSLKIKISRGWLGDIFFRKSSRYINKGDQRNIYEDHIKVYDFYIDPILSGSREQAGGELINTLVAQIGQQR